MMMGDGMTEPERRRDLIRAFSFGASTAAGSMDSEGGFIARVDRYLQDTDSGTATNHGIGGDTTTMMLERLDAVVAKMRDQHGPLALVTLGINDVPRIVDDKPQIRVGVAQHVESLKKMLAAFGEIGDVVYLTQYPVDYKARSLEPELVRSYVTAGEETARSAGVEVIDIFSMITPERFADFIYEDGLHFNNRGHQFIAHNIVRALHASGRVCG